MIILESDGVKILKTDGQLVSVRGTMTISDLKGLVNISTVEVIETVHGDIMLIDEKGKLKLLEFNIRASKLFKYGIDRYGKTIDFIVGDVILVPRNIFIQLDNELEECELDS